MSMFGAPGEDPTHDNDMEQMGMIHNLRLAWRKAEGAVTVLTAAVSERDHLLLAAQSEAAELRGKLSLARGAISDRQRLLSAERAEAAELRKALTLLDGEIEAALAAVRYPRGPEDKLLTKYDLTWEALERFADKTEWALASKLSQCLLDMGGLCEGLAEKAALLDLRERKAHAALKGE